MAELRVALDRKMDVVRHGLHLDDGRTLLGADLSDNLLESVVHGPLDDRAAVLGAPDHVVCALVRDVVVRSDLDHANTIWRGAIYCRL